MSSFQTVLRSLLLVRNQRQSSIGRREWPVRFREIGRQCIGWLSFTLAFVLIRVCGVGGVGCAHGAEMLKEEKSEERKEMVVAGLMSAAMLMSI